MNKWAQFFIDKNYGGKMPRSKIGKHKVQLLDCVKDIVIVDFPDLNGIMGFVPAHRKEFTVTEYEDDWDNGKLSADSLASNMVYWEERGYQMLTKEIVGR